MMGWMKEFNNPTVVVSTPSEKAIDDVVTELVDAGPYGQLEFLGDVLPPSGNYALWTKSDKQHHWFSSITDLADGIEVLKATHGVYYATAAFNEQAAINGNKDARTQANVTGRKCFNLDLDAGEIKLAKHGPDKVYTTQQDGLDSINSAVAQGLPIPSLVISSGEGLHVYWNLDAEVTPGVWQPTARLLGQLVEQYGIKQDYAVTTDSARILRPIGTLHENGKRVSVLSRSGKVYSQADLHRQMASLLKGGITHVSLEPLACTININADVLGAPRQDNRNRDPGLILKGCPMVRAFFDGKAQEEPEWRRVVGVLKFVRDGERLWHEGSAKDPRYIQREAQGKWDGYDKAPTLCGKSAHCKDCPNAGKISTPVQLGDVRPEAPLKPNPDNPQAVQDAVAGAGMSMVMDTDGQLHVVAVTEVEGRKIRTCMLADSQAANDAIISAAGAMGKNPSERAIETFKAKARWAARQTGESQRVYLRVAEINGVIYIDLAPGRIARVDAKGVTVVDDLADGVPLFRRGSGAGQLPNPIMPTSMTAALKFAVGLFVDQFGLTPPQALVTVVTLLEWFRTETPHPIMEAVGPAGSGKSTFADFLRWLFDPSADSGRMTVGTDSKDIGAAAQQRCILQIDNAGRFDKGLSDMLCIVSTGGTLTVRKLYCNGETADLHLRRGLIVTAVSPVCVAADLQSRVIRIELPARVGNYMAESELRASWNAVQPQMLGALYMLLSGALRELPEVRSSGEWGHRLVDFDQMGEAMVKAAGLRPGVFLEAVGQMRERMARRAVSGDIFLMALLAALRKLAANPTHTRQPSLNAVLQLKNQLAVVADDAGRIVITVRPEAMRKELPFSNDFRQQGAIPATARGMTDAIRRVQPLLSSIGVQVQELASGTRTLLRFAFDGGAINED